MSSAIGDLVATLGINTDRWKDGFSSATSQLVLLNAKLPPFQNTVLDLGKGMEEAGGHGHGLYRAELALSHGVRLVGEAFGGHNTALGEAIEGLGGSVHVVGVLSHSYSALTKILDATKMSQIALNLVSGPTGWVMLAAGIVATGAAYLFFSSGADAATEALQKQADALQKFREQRDEKMTPKPEKEFSEHVNVTTPAWDMGSKQLEHSAAQEQLKIEQTGAAISALNDKYGHAIALAHQRAYFAAGTSDAEQAAVVQQGLAAEQTIGLMEQQIAKTREAKNMFEMFLPSTKEKELAATIGAATDKYNDQAATIGMTADQIERYRLVQAGATDATLAAFDAAVNHANAVTNEANALKAGQQMTDAAVEALNKLIEQGKKLASTPLDEYADKLNAIEQAELAGALSAEKAGLARAMAAKNAGIGISQEQQAMIDAANAPILAEQQRQQDQQAGQSLFEHMRTPLEQYRQQMAEFRRLRDVGAIDDKTYARANADAKSKYLAATQQKEGPQSAKALDIRSDEAWRTVVSAMYDKGDTEKAALDTAENTKLSADELAKLNDFLVTILDGDEVDFT